MINLGNHFSRVDGRNSESARQRKWFIKARQDRQKREELAEKVADDVASIGAGAIVASEQQIRKFEVKLDQYDTATVTALMENQKQLDAINLHIEELLKNAHVKDDGRRVFKTEDGEQVFDENGQSVSREELDYDVIGKEKTTWEAYSEATDRRDQLEIKREKLHHFQDKLDESRERLSKGGLTQDELEEMDAELEGMVPSEVKAHLLGHDNSEISQDATVTAKPQVTSQNLQNSAFTPM